MLKYSKQYESLSEMQMKTFRLVLGLNLCLLKVLLVFASWFCYLRAK